MAAGTGVGNRAMAAWRRLPVLIRAPVAAFVVLQIGSTFVLLGLLGNLKFLPQVPWALPATLILLAAFWYYFTGGGFPAATRSSRQYVTRAKSLSLPIWRATALPVLLGMVMVTTLRLILPGILPVEAPKISIDLSTYPLATVIGLLLSIAVSAGVTEEVAFRGYLQKPFEDAYGIAPALLVTGLAFWLAHVDKVSLTHLPFHLTASILLGLLVYMTKSLLPAIVAHTAGDVLLQPAYFFRNPPFVWSALTSRPVWEADGGSTLARKLEAIGNAMAPSGMFEAGPHQTFAILAWTFIASTILTVLALIRLRRATN